MTRVSNKQANLIYFGLLLVLSSSVLVSNLFAAERTTSRPVAGKPPVAPAASTQPAQPGKLIALEILPPRLVFTDRRDSYHLLVTGKRADGSTEDLTRVAKTSLSDKVLRIDAQGYITPIAEGETEIKIQAEGLEAVVPVSIKALDQSRPVEFVRDVAPIINKAGCTSGPCHGAAKGKNGFKLSLRGYDPEFDFEMLVHDVSGRRVNRVDPAHSLMVAKPTMQVPHGGNLRFEPDSRYYKTIVEWISTGTPFGSMESSKVDKLEVLPREILLGKPGMSQQVLVLAHYRDGSERDVTREATFTSNTPTVAEASQEGLVSTARKGESALLVRYGGRFETISITVLDDRPGFQWVQLPQNNYIDRFADDKLRKLRLLPSQLTTDSEFIRRVYLDLIGLPPTPEEVRAFLSEPGENRVKRAQLIDRLLARPEYVDHWAVKWGDLFQNNRKFVGDKGVWLYQQWIKSSLAQNKPYDVWVREMLTAQGSTYENPAANFFRVGKDPKVAMETTTQLFLGVRMVCAQCHDHPFEQWTQNQYYEMTAFFASIGVKEGLDSQEEIVYVKREEGQTKHPKDGRIVAPKVLFGNQGGSAQDKDRREILVRWLTSKDNPYFARSTANRVWSYFFGRGIIEPVDDIRASNPPSNDPLLTALTKDFTDHQFDLRYLIRTIVNSRTYQLSFETNEWNQDDEVNFSHALPRRLPAETLFDAISVATGNTLKFKEVPKGFHAAQFPDATVGMGGFLDLFGRPQRDSACECERRSDVSLTQALNLINGPFVAEAIASPDGRIAKLVIQGTPDTKLVEELYLAAYGRRPEPKELELALHYISSSQNRAEKSQDLMWALLNSNAFLFNR